ncbi:L,D-peptidoglycan transpeptidase YkuD (ErfK/YbiS/YcfS/YnhG family) [Pullulanibacillus pueri]|uniref:SH3b domain-containing protein n=1 Tax=Pullulanibacillus pueri TaxID=1437324 RepID=A0A8J3ENG3_9BACL|nr:SH3 domain-containing protein [Pullulanibacillus pueri]MBM7683374.1 L,D-peptidoglycan transpeptidase YkuD (ErfK/YbiS/YcfS/YnhG family) [Pullulanibacillus pueri]GGH86563.1 hypothetical protein GCM10007096_34560 [Pullulanibacillus pueri]
MKRNKQKIFIGALVTIAIGLIVVLVFSSRGAEKPPTLSSHQATPKVEKTDVVKATHEEASDKKTDKKETTEKKSDAKKTQTENTKDPAQEAKKVEAEKEETAKKETSTSATPTKTVETSTKSAEETIKPVTKYVTVSSLNVRSGAGTNHPAIMMIKQGQAVTVYESSGSWSKIKVNNKTGWVSNKYLSTTKPVVKKTVTQKTSTTTSVKKSQPAPTTTSKPAHKSNVADQLKTVSRNRQLILVTTSSSSTNAATIRTFEKNASGKWNPVLTISGHVGKYGLTSSMSEGGKKSPIGKYTIGTAFGRYANPGTKLSYRKITSDDVWVDDPKSSLYNTWQSRSKTQGQWKSAENMNISAYNYGFVINYNTSRTPYKGSAIFFHVGSGYTLGCTDTAQSNVLKILKWLDPAKSPVIIQTPVSGLSNY